MKALRFRTSNLPRQNGELARVKVLQGPDFGTIFVLTGHQASVGRGEECEIMLADLKTSRRHAEFRLGQNGWEVVDLASANGILINGKRGPQAHLKSGDTLTLGESVLEFIMAEAGTRALAAAPRPMAEVQAANQALEAQRQRVKALGAFGPIQMPTTGSAPVDTAKRNRLLAIVAVGALALYLMPSGGSSKSAKQDRGTSPSGALPGDLAPQDLAAMLPEGPRSPAAEMFFRAGFREYRERNYLRAKTAFENVLMIAPGHRLAMLYRDNCAKSIDDEVKFHLNAAGRDRKAGRLKSARAHFQATLRLLAYDRTNANYTTAQEELEKVERQLRGEIVIETARVPAANGSQNLTGGRP